MAVEEHRALLPADHPSGAMHIIQGRFLDTAHEGTRKAQAIVAADLGGVVRQTGGAVPGLYQAIATGTGLDKWARVGPDVTVANVDLFVRTGVGSDTADGLATGTSLATLAEAIARVPYHIAKGARVIIHLGNGTYPRPVWNTRIIGDHLCIVGDGAGAGNGFTVVTAEQTAAIGTDATKIVDPVGGLTPDAFRGMTILATGGTGSGQRAMIRENDADEYFFARNVATAFDATTTFEVVEAAVELSYAGAFLSLEEIEGLGQTLSQDTAQGVAPCYVLAQVKLTSADTVFVNYSNVSVCMYGVELGGAGSVNPQMSYVSLHLGIDDFFGLTADIPQILGLAANNTEWRGWGVGDVDAGTGRSSLITDMCVIYGYPVLAFLSFAAPGRAFILGGRLFGAPSGTGASLESFATAILTTTASGVSDVKIDADGGRDAVRAGRGGQLILGGALCSAVTGACLRALRGGVIDVAAGSTGTSSGGLAVDTKEGGSVYLDDGGLPTFAGSPTNDYDPGDGGAVPAAFFAADGDYTSSLDASVIQRKS